MTDHENAPQDAAVADLESVLDVTEKLISAVAPGQAHGPTPCPDFDVSQLVDHILGWSESYAVRASGEEFEADANAHRAGPDPTAEFRTYADRILSGYRDVDPAEQSLPLGMLLMDYQVHGWDLARATGQPTPYEDQAAVRALEAGRAMLKPEYRGADQEFGAEVPVPADAPPLTQLVAFMGRDPGWTPPAA